MRVLHNKYTLTCAALAAFALNAYAAPIVQMNANDASTQTAYPASATDLINQGQATFLSETSTGFSSLAGSNTAAMNNGVLGSVTPGNPVADLPDTAVDLDGTWTTTYALNISTNTLGYDITNIKTIAGWVDQRVNQKYELLYSTVALPATFVSLGTFSNTPYNSDTGATNAFSSQITLTDTTGIIASGVSNIRFNFQTPGAAVNDATVYREIDVQGVATVPEPGTFAMLGGMGMLVLLHRRRSASH